MLLDTQPAIEAGEAQNPEGSASTALSHRERDDAYRHVVLNLNPRWRISSCSEGGQWILQYRRTRDRWTGRKYFARAALVPARVKELVGLTEYELAKGWAASHPHT